MLQYKIPQNVGIADKIVGPFSLRQLLIVAVGAGISYILYAISIKLYELNAIEYFVVSLPLLIAIAAALVRIQNVTLTHFLILLLEFSIKPKKRFWDHRGISATVFPDLDSQAKEENENNPKNKRTKKNPNLKDITRILDSGGFDHVEKTEHPDIDASSDDNLMYEAFFGNKKTEQGEVSMYWRTAKDKEAYKRKLKLLSQLPRTEIQALKEVKDEIQALKENQKALHDLPAVQKIISKPAPDKLIPIKEQPLTQNAIQTGNNSSSNKRIIKNPNPVTAPKTIPKNTVPPPVNPPPAKRKRKKKKKVPSPIHPNSQINNTQKNQPVKFVPSQTTNPVTNNINTKIPSVYPQSRGGEINMDNLQGGGIIEFNLED